MKNAAFLFCILTIAFLVRIYNVLSVPPALYWDEIAIGYNAYSIATTGSDEYAVSYPFFFESFQDYKLPGYVYSVVPFIYVLGLTTQAVRLPAIIYGVLTVLFLTIFAKNSIGKKTGLVSGLLLSITPWHIQFTRVGFEVSGALCFITLGLACLTRISQKSFLFIVSVISFSVALCLYNGVRLLAPLLILVAFYVYFQTHEKIQKKIILSTISLLVCLPLILPFASSSALVRFGYTSIFNNEAKNSLLVKKRSETKNVVISKLLYNKYVGYSFDIFSGYLTHLDPRFLFFNFPDDARHKPENTPLLYSVLSIFILLGMVWAIYRRVKYRYVFFLILLSTPIAAAFVLPVPHSLRSLPLVIPFIIFAGIGITLIFEKITKNLPIFICIFVFLLGLQFHNYLFQYYIYYPSQSSRSWAYGYKQAIDWINKHGKNYKTIYLSGYYWRPYIFYLFYSQYSAFQYQNIQLHNQIGNVFFGHASYDTSDSFYDYSKDSVVRPQLLTESNNVLILAPDETPKDKFPFTTINDLEGKPVFVIIKT